MSEEQKEIMEIIEPYTDKTLSEGCYVDTGAKEYQKVTKVVKVYGLFERILDEKEKMTGYKKVLGHYDITAVLKYIEDYGMYIIYEVIGDDIYIGDSRNEAEYYGAIKNKPLHLYTTQENKDLLILLKELCKNYKI